MKKLSILAVSSLLLVLTALAAEKREAEPRKAEKQPSTFTVQVAGQTIATLTGADVVDLSFHAQSDKDHAVQLAHDPAKNVITYKGKCTLEAHKGGKRILQLVVDDGVVIMGPGPDLGKLFEQLSTMPKIKVEK